MSKMKPPMSLVKELGTCCVWWWTTVEKKCTSGYSLTDLQLCPLGP